MQFTDEELDVLGFALDAYHSDYSGTQGYGKRAALVKLLQHRFAMRELHRKPILSNDKEGN